MTQSGFFIINWQQGSDQIVHLVTVTVLKVQSKNPGLYHRSPVSSGRMREYPNFCIPQSKHPRLQSIFALNLPVRKAKGEGGYPGCSGFTLLNLSCPRWEFRTLFFPIDLILVVFIPFSHSFLLCPIFPHQCLCLWGKMASGRWHNGRFL